jgi:Mg2+ and Co2+ transporter CorA
MPPPAPSQHLSALASAEELKVLLVSAAGVTEVANCAEGRDLLAGDKFVWVDVVGADVAARAAWIAGLDLGVGDAAWLQRFGQAGRISLDRRRLRAATWLSEGPGRGLTEIHVLGLQQSVLTVWDGNSAALSDVRERFIESLSKNTESPSGAVAVLLQLILSTLHGAIGSVDAQLVALQRQLAEAPDSVDFAAMNGQTRQLQSIWSEVERYSQAVKCALIGLDALNTIDARGAEALASYAEQVEDLESRLKERSQWGADMLRDYAAAIAHSQSLQIGRLTMVSIIFLPITFLTGFFGMNFAWMDRHIGGPTMFVALGLALPALSVLATTLWLLSQRRRIGGRAPERRTKALPHLY